MRLDLPRPTAQVAVKEILLFSEFSESDTDVAFKIIPAQTKIFTGAHRSLVESELSALNI